MPESVCKSKGDASRWTRVLRLVTVEPVVFCYMFGAFLQYTACLSLTYDKACLMLYNASFCHAMDNKTFQEMHKTEGDAIQTEASYWLIVTNVAMTVPAILSVFFFMGPWGDKIDRKIPLLCPCAGSFLYSLSNLVNAHYLSWPIPAMLLGLAVNGLAGGYSTMLMASYSYATHVSKEKARVVRVGVVGAMIYLAATVSVFISGLLVQEIGHVKVFAIVSAFMGAGFLYCLFVLRSVVPEKQDNIEGRTWFDVYVLSNVRETWAFVTRSRDGNQKLLLVLEIIILNIVHMCTAGESNILYLYLKRPPRSFTRAQYGYFKGSENFTRSLALFTLLPLLRRKLHFRNSTIIIIGLIFKTGTLITLGLADSLVVVFLAAIPALLQGFPSAGLRASMAGRVDLHEHATQSCVTLATTFIFNGWYPSTLEYFDGTCFMFAAGMCVLATGIAVFVHFRSKENKKSESYSAQDNGHAGEDANIITHVADVHPEKALAIKESGQRSADDLGQVELKQKQSEAEKSQNSQKEANGVV
ncbi:proton-coupled folate transporter [Plakobranchus ocellatus]|uniref:Proton-coupled folate transporter n=1 Tax=Plakobranchus ocellatus TaxID=259542 RepID=A0AAV4AYW8_9GAST|nr:proton-coupled folate transporter [Plakobranchus ocellatus]